MFKVGFTIEVFSFYIAKAAGVAGFKNGKISWEIGVLKHLHNLTDSQIFPGVLNEDLVLFVKAHYLSIILLTIGFVTL